MAGPRGREKVRREAHWDPPQRRGGSGKGAEGRSLPSGSEGSEREHLSPGSVPLPPEAGRLCARGTGPVTCSCGGRNCVICLLLPSRILCPSLSPLFLSVISLHLLRDGGVPGLLRVLSLESHGPASGDSRRSRRHLMEHPGNGRGGESHPVVLRARGIPGTVRREGEGL